MAYWCVLLTHSIPVRTKSGAAPDAFLTERQRQREEARISSDSRKALLRFPPPR